jgi:predicted ATP-grasp superfamily ATP-dependent carboligase
MKLKSKFSVLIPDGESMLLRNVINCLSSERNIKIYVLSDTINNEMRYSRYIHKFFFIPKNSYNEDWISSINKITDTYSINVIMPIYEFGIQAIIKHKLLIKHQSKIVPLPSLDSFTIANNKGLLSKHLVANNINSPISRIVNKDTFEEHINEFDFPTIIKPVEESNGGTGVQKCNSKQDVFNYLNSQQINHNFILQNYIIGYDIDCSVLCKDGKILIHTIQKGTMFDKTIFNPQLALEFMQNKRVYDIVAQLMESLNWSGVAHIDLRYDEKNNEYKVIEISPRFWQSVLASVSMRANFPLLIAQLIITKNLPQIELLNKANFINLKGLYKLLKTNPLRLLNVVYLWKKSPIKYIFYDPIPVIYKIYGRIKLNNSKNNTLILQLTPFLLSA